MTNPDTLAGGVKLEAADYRARRVAFDAATEVAKSLIEGNREAGGEGLKPEFLTRAIVTSFLAALPATGAVLDFDAALKAFIKSVREQDSEWTDDIDEGEVLLTSPSGDYFAPYYPLLAALSAASPPYPSGREPEPVERERWREMVQAHAAAMQMVIDAVEELFGPIASMESEDASLLRGPEPHHRAEGVVEALQRVRQVIPSVDAEARKRAIIAGWKDYSGNADFEEIETVIDTALDTLFAASSPKPSEAMVEAAVDLLAELAKHPGWELSQGYDGDNEDFSDYGWRVLEISGGANDRVWRLIGFGKTPAQALTAALAGGAR